ncbi:lanthionine synthetase LanC family protein [Winogradskyella eximia]|uniref:lanthionine synthetase LanC family protein n=1 Tax=Winogradskyella eximia TaxID=262006 RepID=UPI00249166EC|nr:lanthionine synthetase LanC family protein [Winogradskyella eximia]
MKTYLSNIERFVWESVSDEERIGMLNGLSGLALFYANILKQNPQEYQEKLIHIIEKVNEIISTQDVLPSMCSGFSGYGIVLVNCQDSLTIDESYFESIDELLFEFLLDDVKDKNYDLLHGAIGISLYFVERYQAADNDRAKLILDNYFDQLISDLTNHFDDVVRTKEIDGTQVYYFGIAHGVSGLINHIIFLSNTLTKNTNAIHAVLKRLVEFLETFKTNETFKYPNYHLIDKKASVQSRLSWCQGDMGIGNALINYGEFIMDDELKNEGITLIRDAMEVPFNHTEINDFGICHGSSGVLLQYSLFLQKLELEEDEIISFWKQKIIEQTKTYTKFKAFLRKEFVNETNILEGASGLALTLLTVNKEINTNWLKCFNIN